MIKIRAERPVSIGDICEIKGSVYQSAHDRPYTKLYNSYKLYNFEKFFVIRDNILGNKGLSVIIPVRHQGDVSEYNFAYMSTWLKKREPKRFVVFTKTLQRLEESMNDVYPNKNEAQLKTICNFLNEVQLSNDLVKLQWEGR